MRQYAPKHICKLWGTPLKLVAIAFHMEILLGSWSFGQFHKVGWPKSCDAWGLVQGKVMSPFSEGAERRTK